MHKLSLVVLSLATLAAAADVLAQARGGQEIVYSVEGFPPRMSTRKDGKINALAFSFGVQTQADPRAGAGGGTGKPAVQDFVLSIPVGDPSTLFMKSALRGEGLRSVLIEIAPAGEQGPRAPFAARLTDVRVTSVQLSKASSDGGSGIAEVKLRASKFEIFTGSLDPAKGGVQPGQQLLYDQNTGKSM